MTESNPKWSTTGHWTTPYYGYVESLELAEAALKNYTTETESKYIVYQKDKAFGAQDLNLHKCRIFFQANEERQANPLSVWPEFDGVPFIVLGRKFYGCHLGKDKDYGAKLKLRVNKDAQKDDSPKSNLRATKKIGCPAKISMAQIVKFPQYKVATDNELQRRATFKKLHNDLNKDPTSVQFELRFYIKFNKPGDHTHTKDAKAHKSKSAKGHSMDYRLVRHLCKLHHQGMSRLSDIETALTEYIHNHLYSDDEAPIPSADISPELYPDRIELQSHLNHAQCIERLLHMDTTVFNKVVDEWRQLCPTHNFYYQKYIKEETKSKQQVKEHQYARNMVEPDKLQSFVFCYQSETKRRLLNRFGQNMTVLDLAIKGVPVPTYFLMVHTNTCYQVVGMISMQFPYAETLKRALQFIREHNPGWQPQYFMVDNIPDDIAVVEQVFPDTKVHILNIFRENAWRTWMEDERKSRHGKKAEYEAVYGQLERIATSKTETEANLALANLKKSTFWGRQDRFRFYFTSTWIKSIKRWAHYGMTDSLIVTLQANDGLNSLKSALKYDWLDEAKTRSLTETFSGIISEHLPAHYCKHMSQNLVLPAIASYNANEKSLPGFVKTIPPTVQPHVVNVLKSLPNTAQVTMHAPGVFTVAFPHEEFPLSFGNETRFPSCSCADWPETRMLCQHFCTIFGSFPEWGWSKLSVRYINNPMFAVDEDSLPTEIQSLFKVDSLQLKAEMARKALESARVESLTTTGTSIETGLPSDNPTIHSPSAAAESDNQDDIVTFNFPNPATQDHIADADIMVATSETVLSSESAPPSLIAAAPSRGETTTQHYSVMDIYARCKHQLETLNNSLGNIDNVDDLLKLEQRLVVLADDARAVQQRRKPWKRRRVEQLEL